MEKTKEKSEEQAQIIMLIASVVDGFDVEYCEAASADMLEQASRQASMMVLNPRFSPIKNDILVEKGKALKTLCRYVKSLKKIQKMNKELHASEENQNKIDNLFTY